MKTVYSFLYIVSFVIYLYLGGGDKVSGGLNIITQLLFTLSLIEFIKDRKPNSKKDILSFNYVIGLTFCRIVLTLITMIASDEWSRFITRWYSHAVLASLIIFIAININEYRKS